MADAGCLPQAACVAITPMLPFLAEHAHHEPTGATVETEHVGMTKADLTQHLADKTKLTWQHAEFVVNAIFACVEQALRRGERVELRGFGLRDPLIGIKEFQTLEQKPVARKLGGQMRPLGAQATPPASLEWLHTNSCLG